MNNRIWLSVSLLAFFIAACGSKTTTTHVYSDEGAPGSDAVNTSPPPSGDTTPPTGDEGPPGEDTASGPVDQCGTPGIGTKGLGEACTDHAECGTNYCYDEELWNEDGNIVHRFCTAKCTGCTVVDNCNDWPKAQGVLENKCTPLTSYFINFHKLSATSVCLVRCSSDAECANLGSFTTCAGLTFGKEKNYGVGKYCQPPDFVHLPDQY